MGALCKDKGKKLGRIPVLAYLSSSIWASPAQTSVNTDNVVGAMGKGIALEFKRKYPEMYQRYRELCEAKSCRAYFIHHHHLPPNNANFGILWATIKRFATKQF